MVTYLPTILMNMINQATNYISGEDKYSMIYATNITCMMVLASVYLSVSASLSPTSDIKPVEVWLLFNLAFPLTVILLNVLLQVEKQKENKEIIRDIYQGLEKNVKRKKNCLLAGQAK